MDQLQSVRIHAADTKAQGRRLKRHCIFLHRHTAIAQRSPSPVLSITYFASSALGPLLVSKITCVILLSSRTQPCEHCVKMQINAALQQHPLRDQFIAFRIMGNIPQRMLYLRSVGFHHTLYEFPGNPPHTSCPL